MDVIIFAVMVDGRHIVNVGAKPIHVIDNGCRIHEVPPSNIDIDVGVAFKIIDDDPHNDPYSVSIYSPMSEGIIAINRIRASYPNAIIVGSEGMARAYSGSIVVAMPHPHPHYRGKGIMASNQCIVFYG
ncbi:MAG: hypothetical protein IT564_11470 [Rhodospirillales bacterium]|nr:hypothetical protein [Rhodospirillales bacterium]